MKNLRGCLFLAIAFLSINTQICTGQAFPAGEKKQVKKYESAFKKLSAELSQDRFK